ncbi:MAG: hypothetical protein IIY62_01465 [Kiritimatiellae bacterium]|nr:hypothetical protein [Kiritimatiellia bacterium]
MANLAQLRRLEDLDGFLLVDKPEGLSFSTVLKTVKRKFNLVKAGHGGSLDTMASGLLVLLVGDANRYVDRVMGADRAYSGVLRFGATTDTGDRFGRPAPLPDPVLPVAEATGDVFQTEPRFCAVRREGAADYEVVDTGAHTPSLAHVYRLDVAPGDGAERSFSLTASKNLLPRALAIDLGATLVALRREKVGKFDVKDAVPFAKLLETEIGDFASFVLPLAKALA